MRTKSGIILAAVAIGSLYYGSALKSKEYSAEEVFRRAKPAIETLMRADPVKRDEMIDRLKARLRSARDDTERCKVGLFAEATARTKGDEVAAAAMIERRSLTPYLECEPDHRDGNSPNRWYTYGGIIGLIVAGISLVTNLAGTLMQRSAARRTERAARTEAARARRRREDEERREDDGGYDEPPRTDPDA